MATGKNSPFKNQQRSIDPSELKWKWVHDFELNTPLGIDDCRVEVLESDEAILKPGEDERVRKLQVRPFCEWIVQSDGHLLGEQLHYLLGVFELSQKTLASALGVSRAAVSLIVNGQNRPSRQTCHFVALLFELEIEQPGTITRLASGRLRCRETPALSLPQASSNSGATWHVTSLYHSRAEEPEGASLTLGQYFDIVPKVAPLRLFDAVERSSSWMKGPQARMEIRESQGPGLDSTCSVHDVSSGIA